MMPMIKIGDDIKDIKIWEKNIEILEEDISKVYKGDELIWEKIKFKGFEINTWGSVNFNGNYKDQLPLNVPLKLIIRNNKHLDFKVNYKFVKPLKSGEVFMLKTKDVFTISTNGMLDIEIKQTSEWPEYIFE